MSRRMMSGFCSIARASPSTPFDADSTSNPCLTRIAPMPSTTTLSSSTIRTCDFGSAFKAFPWANLPAPYSYRQNGIDYSFLVFGGDRSGPLRLDLLLHDLEESSYLLGSIIEMGGQAASSQPR